MANQYARRWAAVVSLSVGFICEGKVERKIIESPRFQATLQSMGIECIRPVINADGSGNLLPRHIADFRNTLLANGAQKIVVLTDLDEDRCVTQTKERSGIRSEEIIVVAVRQIEAWFLADNQTLSRLLNKRFSFDTPEAEAEPFKKLKAIFLQETGRGVGTKDILAQRMLKYDFSVENAAAHPNCTSAKYFLNKLKTINHSAI